MAADAPGEGGREDGLWEPAAERGGSRRWTRWVIPAALIVLVIFLVGRRSFGPDPMASWHSDYAAARAEALASDRPILMVLTASWCGPCRQMKRGAWSDERVQQILAERYVPLKVDLSDRGPNAVVDRLGFTQVLLPTIVITDAEANIKAQNGPMTANQTVAFLTGTLPGE